MRKIYKTVIIFMLLISIAFVSNSAELNELQENKNEIQAEIDKTNEELNEVNNELTENLQQIQKLDNNIQETEESLRNLNNEIENTEKDINKIQEDLQNITNRYNTQKEMLNSRLVTIYEDGNVNYLDMIVHAKSLSDLVSIYYIISELTSYDIELLEDVEREKNSIEDKKTKIDNYKSELETKKRTLSKTEIALSNTKLLRTNYLSKLNEEEQNLQAKIDEYYSQINQIEAEIRSLAKVINFGEDYAVGTMQWPIPGHTKITSNYGMRTHPITGVYKLHTGVDISAGIGTDFVAMANGVVVKAEYNGAYGNMVIIDHGGGVQTLYAHGSEIVVNVGQVVNAGDTVLKVGSTGYSTGPHAHFEVRVNGSTMNPLDYVSVPEQ